MVLVKTNGRELTFANIKAACKEHFRSQMKPNEEIDILGGERGPSYTCISEIKKFDPLHIRFVAKVGVASNCQSSIIPPTQAMKRAKTSTAQSAYSSAAGARNIPMRSYPSSRPSRLPVVNNQQQNQQ
eukprot:TCONS_00032584-protein